MEYEDRLISIKINSYDDIFSDFDPRPYPNRALSDDFLLEAKKASLDKMGNISLQFLAEKKIRNIDHESLIKKRLREHFRKHHELISKEVKEIKKRGIVMAILGIIMIALAAFISSFGSQDFLVHLIIIILEPAGWFTAWTGLDEIYYTTKSMKPDLDFYQKMAQSDIQFISI